MTQHLCDLDEAELGALLKGEPAYRVRQVWEGLYQKACLPQDLTTLPKPLRARLAELAPPSLVADAVVTADGGQTIKTAWLLPDGLRVESVLMHYRDRSTVCVSSQAGCAMGCTFCATGQAGFERHLQVGEIVEQVLRAIATARPRRVDNIVLMGMGEPLANYDRVLAALRRIHGHVGISARHLTISTVGVVPGIRRLATEPEPFNLAISLHAGNDKLRSELVPLNRRYPIVSLMSAARHYVAAKGRRLSFEWAMIDGVNDREIDATELAALARPLGAHVNLIPLNRTPGYPVQGSPGGIVDAFCAELHRLGVNATIRRNRGSEIDAACGQLAASAAAAKIATSPASVKVRIGHRRVPSQRQR